MIQCVRFRPHRRNTLRGFCDLELVRTGIIISDCTWHRHANGKEWVGFPARPYTDKNGESQWQALIEFAPGAKQAREQFQVQALAAIHAVAEETVS